MADSYGIIGTGVRPVDLNENEWILVPADHEYIGIIRVCNQDPAAQTFRLAHTAATGAATGEDWDCYDTTLEIGQTIDITMEMAALETIRVQVSKIDVISFKYTGMDRDNS
jgi:hypothetical protein